MIRIRCKKSIFTADIVRDAPMFSERNRAAGISELDRMDFRDYINGKLK